MPLPADVTFQQFQQNARTALMRLRAALLECEAQEAYAAGLSLADLQAAGDASPAGRDGQLILSALADANGLKQKSYTGTDPRSGPPSQPGYVYATSMINAIGPQQVF